MKKHLAKRTKFDYEILEDDKVIAIFDLNSGMSVTNNIENICDYIENDLKKDNIDLKDYKIIYQDSEGIFDGIKYNSENKFVSFFPIQETDLENAIAKLILNYP